MFLETSRRQVSIKERFWENFPLSHSLWSRWRLKASKWGMEWERGPVGTKRTSGSYEYKCLGWMGSQTCAGEESCVSSWGRTKHNRRTSGRFNANSQIGISRENWFVRLRGRMSPLTFFYYLSPHVRGCLWNKAFPFGLSFTEMEVTENRPFRRWRYSKILFSASLSERMRGEFEKKCRPLWYCGVFEIVHDRMDVVLSTFRKTQKVIEI